MLQIIFLPEDKNKQIAYTAYSRLCWQSSSTDEDHDCGCMLAISGCRYVQYHIRKICRLVIISCRWLFLYNEYDQLYSDEHLGCPKFLHWPV